MSEVARCRECGREIVFEVTIKGARVPLDHPPEKRYVKLPGENRVALVDAWTSHFATCTNPDRFRKPRTTTEKEGS